MGYLGRRIGKAQNQGDSNPGGANGEVGGGILDLFTHGYFEQQGGIHNYTPTPAGPQGIEASGGIISDYTEPGGEVYRAHIFTTSGQFDVTALGAYSNTTEYLVVAGGGSGGYEGGGGAGGVRTNLSGHPLATNNPTFNVTAGVTYTMTVGGGGVSGGLAGPNSVPTNGTPSQIIAPGPTVIVASTGGGGGGNYPGINGRFGGSGGGDATDGGTFGYGINPSTPAPLGGPYPHTEGYPGAPYPGVPYAGMGGGGAGGAGHGPGDSPGGAGGEGVQVLIAGPNTTRGIGGPGPSSQDQWYGGGGGGGASLGPNEGGAGGMGTWASPYAGGGHGIKAAPADNRIYGMQNTGGGGGGVWNGTTGIVGGGGSGIIIVRYQIGVVQAAAKATGGAVSYYGGKTIHTFTTSGTFETKANWTAADVEYVVVGGGGAGGEHRYRGGGGGAGNYKTGSVPIGAHPVSTTVQVGAGGIGLAHVAPSSAGNGTPSFFGPPITAPGGGMGGTYTNNPGIAGGSSGGGGGGPSPATGTAADGDPFPGTVQATPPNGWGHAGGDNNDTPIGAGGGGAGAAGYPNNPNSTPTRGLGGAGVQIPSTFRNPMSEPTTPAGGIGTPGPAGDWYLAGGGNAGGYGVYGNPAVKTTRPAGGGGFGGNQDVPDYDGGENGMANTGGGGGGASSTDSGKTSGSGGSGIVIVAYPS